jgi:hypothetical protein
MPLRDHFRPPLDNLRYWEGFHATWPVMIVARLRHKLPRGYLAVPRVHAGSSAEVDVATFHSEHESTPPSAGNENGGGVATAVWAPPRPTLTIPTDFPTQDIYEVRVYDQNRGSRLVAAVEIVSPGNKDRAEHRQAFISKCAGLLQERVSVVIVDLVTTRTANLYGELLDLIELTDPLLKPEPPSLYVAACRSTKKGDKWLLETWLNPLNIGQPLPTVPLWLADDLAVPLELNESYEESCDILSIP